MDQFGNFWAQGPANGTLSATLVHNPRQRSLQRVSQGKGEPKRLLLGLSPTFPATGPRSPLAATLDG